MCSDILEKTFQAETSRVKRWDKLPRDGNFV